MKNFKSEIGCVIVCKMLIYRKIRGYFPKIHKSSVSCRKTNVSAVETFISIVGTI
jgi:hypothetical protein